MTLKGQTVVILGGGGGIGRAVVELALEEGAQVAAYDMNGARLEALEREFPAVRTRVLDILDEAAVAAALRAHERLDHVYVAAGSTRLGKLLEEPVADQLAPLMLRLLGSAYAIRGAMPRLRPGGSVTLTGGLSTDRPVPGAWVSSVATAAAEQLARAMALELAPVRFNAIAPGWTDTPMWDAVLGAQKEQVFAQVRAQQLTGRLATAREVGMGVLLLMKNESMTGEVLHVDGGRRLT